MAQELSRFARLYRDAQKIFSAQKVPSVWSIKNILAAGRNWYQSNLLTALIGLNRKAIKEILCCCCCCSEPASIATWLGFIRTHWPRPRNVKLTKKRFYASLVTSSCQALRWIPLRWALSSSPFQMDCLPSRDLLLSTGIFIPAQSQRCENLFKSGERSVCWRLKGPSRNENCFSMTT